MDNFGLGGCLVAKMRPGPVVGAASGSLGCVTVSPGTSGHVLRVRSKPVRRDSEATSRSRGSFASMSRAWSALSAAERAAWDTWAAGYREVDVLGQERRLSGREGFCRLNSRLDQAGAYTLTAPPDGMAEGTVYDAYLTASAALVLPSLLVPGFTMATTGQAWVWVAVMMGGGGRRWQDQLKLCVRYSLPGFVGLVPFGQEYLDRWGTLIEGQRLYCVLRRLDTSTGFLSPPVLVIGTATA